ncbi:unnamed protein product, partial [Urochloa humidicola]
LPPRASALLHPVGALVAAGAPPRRSDPGVRRDAAAYGEREAAATRPPCLSFRAWRRRPAAAVCRRRPVRPAAAAGRAAASAWCGSATFRGRAARGNGWVQGSTAVPGPLCCRATHSAAFQLRSAVSGPLHVCAAVSGPLHVCAAIPGPLHLCSTSSGPLHFRSTASGHLHFSPTISAPLCFCSTVSGPLYCWTTAAGPLCCRTSTFSPPTIVPWAATVSYRRCVGSPTELCEAATTTVARVLPRCTTCKPSIPKASISTASADYATPSNGTNCRVW